MNAFGVYGVGVMGRGIALNVASKGHRVAIYNKETERMSEVLKDAHFAGIHTLSGYYNVRDFMASLVPPRKVLMMVPAGKAVDEVISSMSPYIKSGDVIIDGGNEWYERTEARQQRLFDEYGAHLIGMGVSGGAYGARHGAAFMPGGEKEAVQLIMEFVQSASDPKSHPGYVGAGGSGNYVKMVHNGIEYAVMQIIAETYDILKRVYMLDDTCAKEFFERANCSLHSYLLDITTDILARKDDDGSSLIDKISDVAKMNGTGTWTAKDALEMMIPCPSIAAAIDARLVSTDTCDRVILSHLIKRDDTMAATVNPEEFMESDHESCLRSTMITAMYLAYLQGFLLIHKKSEKKQWSVNLCQVAQTWMGGCIIRSNILHFFAVNVPLSYKRQLFHMLSDNFDSYAQVMTACVHHRIHVPVLSASYQYILGYTTSKSTANLIQAQRDYFGSHGYERVDRQGLFHTEWNRS